MTELLRAVVSVTRTKRRRYLWCAWWSGEPCVDPFRPPDAWSGGAMTVEEAIAAAEKAAGLSLDVAEGRWAGAWLRMRRGLPPFPQRSARTHHAGPKPIDPHAVLGVTPGASLEEVKAQFRVKALQLHPDHGGDAAGFIALKRAYDALTARRRRPA